MSVEIDRADVGLHFGRAMVDIADDGDIAMRDDAILHCFNRGRGNVHDDVSVAEGEIDPGQPLG